MPKREISIGLELNSNSVIPIIGMLDNFINQDIDTELDLIFTGTKFVRPGGLTPLLAYLASHKNDDDGKMITLKATKTSDVNLYLSRMGFYTLLGLEDTYPYNRKPAKGRFQEPYIFSVDTNPQEVTEKSSNIINTFIKNRYTQNYNEAIGWCINEIIDNAHTRSNSRTSVIMAQKYNSGNTEFCVSDCGIGIRESMGEDNIETALRKCITTAKGINSDGCGKGLFYTAELIKRDASGKCSMTIWSEDYILMLYSGMDEPQVKQVESFWQGVNISISMYNGISTSITELMKNIDNQDYSFSYDEQPEYYENLFEN